MAKAKRRGNNEGSIVKREDGRWMARVYLPLGRRKAIYADTREEVARLLAEELVEVEGGSLPPAGKATLAQWLTAWLKSIKLSKIRPRTWERYRQYIEVHAIPALGTKLLRKVEVDDLEALYTAKLEEGLSVRTVHHLHVVLKKAFSDAEKRKKIRHNPARFANIEGIDRDEDAERIKEESFTEQQLKAFIRAAKGHRLETLFVMAATLGMREGELLGLRWENVDLDAGTITIKETLQNIRFNEGDRPFGKRLTESFVLARPKTEKSRRVLTLTPRLIEHIRRHRAAQGEERIHIGKLWNNFDLVFCTPIGTPIHYGNLLRREYYPLLLKIGLATEEVTTEKRMRRGEEVTVERRKIINRVTFHTLRHSCATVMLRDEVKLQVVSSLLGHAKTSTTADLYQHAEGSLVDDAVKAMSKRLLGS